MSLPSGAGLARRCASTPAAAGCYVPPQIFSALRPTASNSVIRQQEAWHLGEGAVALALAWSAANPLLVPVGVKALRMKLLQMQDILCGLMLQGQGCHHQHHLLLQEQAAKEALAAELAARGVRVGGGQPKKRRRNEDTKNLSPAETPAEATYNMLKQKGLGSKINIEAVGGLYDTKDEDGEADEKGDMGFDGEYTQDIGDGETFEGGYDYADYNNNGYGGAGDYTDHDDF